jgi:hypothetical protein
MIRKMATILAPCLLALLVVRAGAAQDLFYTGAIIIDDIEVIVDIGSEAVITAHHVLTNRGDVEESITLSVPEGQAAFWEWDDPVTDPITFQSGETKTVKVIYTVPVEGEGTRSLSFKPAITFDGAWHPEPPA